MHFLPLLYVAIFGFLIAKLEFFRDDKLPRFFFVSIFIVKVLLGLLYHAIFSEGDILYYYKNAAYIIYPVLWQDPLKYLYLTFGPNGGSIPEFIFPQVHAMGYWGDTSDYMVVRFNAIVRLFSFGNFYVHVVFMSFISLVGMVWLYRACARASGTFSLPVAAAIFLIPSVLFWGSGANKEGLVLFALGWFLYGSVLLVQKSSVRNFLIALTGAFLTYCVRDYVLFMLLPGMVVFFITYKNWGRIRFLLPIIYAVIIAAIIILPIFGGKNFAEVIALRQAQFKSLEQGSTHVTVKDFQPDWTSFFTNFPQALKNSILGPFFIKPDKAMHYLIIAENLVLLIAGLLFPWITGKPRWQPFTLMCLLFSISLFVLIGYIVPNVGAIVRYRSIALPFLFIFLYSGEKQGVSEKS